MEPCTLTIDEARAWFDRHPHPNVLEPMAHHETKVYVALRNEQGIVASATLQKRALGFAQVGGIFVVEALRGTGAGRRLMDAVGAEARRLGARRLVLGAYRREPDVSPFYRAVGFRAWLPYIPGTESPHILGLAARGLAKLFRVEAGPDAIRIMVRKA